MSRITLLSLSLLAASQAFAGNIVADGTFEAGGAAWNTSDAGSVVNLPNGCHAGSNYCGQFAGNPLGNINQYVATVPGATYTVSFFLKNTTISTAGPNNSFHFQWGNLIPNATSVFNSGGFDWAFFTTDVVADSNSMWVSFQGYHNTGAFLLDNVWVEGPDGSVPEPSSWLLAAAGFAALLARRRSQ
ncbi:MAG: PEP-CTERM sorting domain-containing protein [Bryobacterales bacterium]|nr:PEP-CTERM sorting domain-containing protein [Bryobacterales bacterium]